MGSAFSPTKSPTTLGIFINSPQYKNANIANFVLAVPLKIKWTNEISYLEMESSCIHWCIISH